MPPESRDLRLAPLSPAHILALIDGNDRFQQEFGHPAAPGMREFYTSGEVSPQWIDQLRASANHLADPWLHGLAIIHLQTGQVIGVVGFKAPPDADGAVELAYGIAPAFQNQGHATAAARLAMEFALADPRVKRIIAHTLPTPNASTRVLTKCGFTFTGQTIDPTDGLVWRWEHSHKVRGR